MSDFFGFALAHSGNWEITITERFNWIFFLLQSLEESIPEEREGRVSTLTQRLLNPQEEGSFWCTALAYAILLDLSYCQMLFLVSTHSFCEAFTLLLLLWVSLLWPCIYFPSFISSLIRYSNFHYSQAYTFFHHSYILFSVLVAASPLSSLTLVFHMTWWECFCRTWFNVTKHTF